MYSRTYTGGLPTYTPRSQSYTDGLLTYTSYSWTYTGGLLTYLSRSQRSYCTGGGVPSYLEVDESKNVKTLLRCFPPIPKDRKPVS